MDPKTAQPYANWCMIAEVYAKLGWIGMHPSQLYANLGWVWEGGGGAKRAIAEIARDRRDRTLKVHRRDAGAHEDGRISPGLNRVSRLKS